MKQAPAAPELYVTYLRLLSVLTTESFVPWRDFRQTMSHSVQWRLCFVTWPFLVTLGQCFLTVIGRFRPSEKQAKSFAHKSCMSTFIIFIYCIISDMPHTVHVQKGCAAIDTKFMSTPRSTTSEQHLSLIASLSSAGKYNNIWNVLEKCWGVWQIRGARQIVQSESKSIPPWIWSNSPGGQAGTHCSRRF